MIPRATATMGEILKDNGYPRRGSARTTTRRTGRPASPGPFDRWPTGMGFDYFYGFIGGETNQYYPVIFENTTPVEPRRSRPKRATTS